MPLDVSTKIPISLRALDILLRAIFIGALVAIAVRVSLPQSETFWSVYETPSNGVEIDACRTASQCHNLGPGDPGVNSGRNACSP